MLVALQIWHLGTILIYDKFSLKGVVRDRLNFENTVLSLGKVKLDTSV